MRIVVSDLVMTYRAGGLEDRTVLRVPGWDAASGSAWLLHGVSGSGKTSLLNILAGLLPPTSGRVVIGETDPYARSEADRDRWRASTVGYVHQAHLLVSVLSAAENVELGLRFAARLSRSERRERAVHALEAVGLADHRRHRPTQLSIGQQQRVAVARALAAGPSVILADEPTAALDPDNADHVLELLLEDAAERGATLIVASHDPALDVRFEHRLALSAGRLVDLAAA
jgi:putative ABC transport system ATP-binding protein